MSQELPLSRKELITATIASLAATGLAKTAEAGQGQAASASLAVDDLKAVERLLGLEFTDAERADALSEIRSNLQAFQRLREVPISFTTDPMTVFTPVGGGSKPSRVECRVSYPRTKRPTKDADIAFLNLRQLGHLLRSRQITSVELTRLYLQRLRSHGERLLCVVTLTEEIALKQAERADRELREGKDRGPLHGIPYGIKDLFATRGAPTTWGADPYKTQTFDFNATVVDKLEQAGAVLVAKLSMGALAMGDVWFGGTTKNPWNLAQGSSGSSAGSASATSAGLVAFSIGTETYGSITSPSLQCRVTGFRPSYGRISRYGAMELSYTMDKVGPICRSAEDCAIVFAAICGSDPQDPSAVDRDFRFPLRPSFKSMKAGFLGSAEALAADPASKALRELGVEVKPKSFTPVPNGVLSILGVEASSAFESFTRTGQISGLKNSAWPRIFRGARYVPAVEYIQAQRVRAQAMRRFEEEWADLDFLIGPGLTNTIMHTNLGGHPQVLLPWGADERGNSVGRSLIGRLYRDDLLISVATALQARFDYHLRRPEGF